MSSVFLTNQQHILQKNLIDNIFESKQNFFRKLVVVPCDAQKKEIIEFGVTKKGIFTGVRFLNLNMAMQHLLELTRSERLRLPKQSLLPLYLEGVLSEIEHPQLLEYIGNRPARRRGLAKKLAKEFFDQAIYGVTPISGWEKEVWDRFRRDWDIPIDAFQLEHPPAIPVQVHFYGFSHIPSVYHRFLLQLEEHIPITYYMLSPSEHYWGDSVSEREAARLAHFYEKKGVTEEELDQLKGYLEKCPPLLGNNTAFARQLYCDFIDSGRNLIEDYCVVGERLLHAIQRDVMEHGTSEQLMQDDSVQLHIAPSCRREVDVLLSVLINLYDREPFSERDVIVYCPDAQKYASHIALVFGGEDSPFGYVIEGLPRHWGSRYLRQIVHWIELMESRFEPEVVMKVLQPDDYETVNRWITDTQIRWGYNQEHKERILDRPSDGQGTWQRGFEQLMTSLVQTAGMGDPPFFATHTIEFSETELLEDLMAQLEWFYTTQRELNSEKWAEEWALYLQSVFDEMSKGECDEGFDAHLQGLGALHLRLPFSSVREYLLSYLQAPAHTMTSKDDKPRIVFLAPKEGCALSKKVVWFLGLDEESFPKVALGEHLLGPKRVELERNSFLTAFLGAKEVFGMSYPAKLEDGTDLAPSILLEDLEMYPIKKYMHKAMAYHCTYFDPAAEWPERRASQYQLAKHYYDPISTEEPHIFTQFPTQTQLNEISVAALKSFASHPLRYFYNHTLGIYFDQNADEDEKEFILTPIDRANFHIALLKGEQPMQELEEVGALPHGPFAILAKKELALLPNKETFAIDVEVQLGDYTIVGSLEGCSEEGFVSRGTSKLGDVIKIWPLFLLYTLYYPEKKRVVCLKDGKVREFDVDSKSELAKYLDYFTESLSLASPLLPQWAESLLVKDAAALENDIAQTISGAGVVFTDRYALSAKNANSEKLHAQFSPRLREIFQSLIG